MTLLCIFNWPTRLWTNKRLGGLQQGRIGGKLFWAISFTRSGFCLFAFQDLFRLFLFWRFVLFCFSFSFPSSLLKNGPWLFKIPILIDLFFCCYSSKALSLLFSVFISRPAKTDWQRNEGHGTPCMENPHEAALTWQERIWFIFQAFHMATVSAPYP